MRDAKERDEALTTWQKQNATQHTEVEKRPEWIPNSKKDESPMLHIFDERTEKPYGIYPDNPPLNVSKFDIPKSADAAREYEMTGATFQQAVKNELLKLRKYHGHPLGLWWTGYHVPAKELYQRGVELVLLFDTMWKAQAK